MATDYVSTTLQQFSQELAKRCQQQASGDLILKTDLTANAGTVKLSLLYGRFVYAMVEDFHQVRRLRRAIQKYCPSWQVQTLPSVLQEQPWEYQLLCQGLNEKQIDLAQGKKIIRQVLLEVSFFLDGLTQLTYQWESTGSSSSGIFSGLGLSSREIEPVFVKASEMSQQWQGAGLGKINPNFSPVLKKQVEPEALSGMSKYLNGKFTIWDMAQQLEKQPLAVTRSLVPLIKQGIIQLRQIRDLPNSFVQPAVSAASAKKTAPARSKTNPTAGSGKINPKGKLIACIDDSPVIAQTLRQILEPAGYRIMSVLDPIKGLAEIAEHKPDLIFLDLMMPNANGYTVCQFLRNASAFQRTPIVILTSRDNVLDRSRAKMVGASDFLAKPPKLEETLEVITKHLGSNDS
ncbi:MAG: response regulator [Microcoleaceae cyanobacterium]